MGHYSRFIRPGMKRFVVERDDLLTDEQSSQDLMCSAFGDQRGKTIIVMINYTSEPRIVNCNLQNKNRKNKSVLYSTTADKNMNMEPSAIADLHQVRLLPRSINTIVIE